MADDITLNSGSGGSVVATDQAAGGEHYQVVKLADGTADSTTHIPLSGDLTNGLDVDVTRVGGTVTVDLGANNDVTIEGGAVLGTTGSAGPANAISVGGTESGGTFRELAVDSSGNLQVDIVSGGGTQYAEDTAHNTGDTGTMALAVRNDTLAALAGTDGDYSALQVNANGALYVNVENITSEVTFGTTTYTEASSTGLLSGAVRNDTLAALANTDNEVAPLQVNATGALYVDGSNATQPVSGTVTANLSATDNTVLDTIETNTDFGTVVGGGAEATALRVTLANDSTGVISIDDGGNTITVDGTVNLGTAAVTNAGTFAVQEDGAALTALQVIDNSIKADDAAFTLASDSVNMAGAVRDDTLSTLTAIEGDAVPLRVNSTGALHVTGAGGGTQYTVDDPNPTTVTMAGVVRDDSLTTLTEADGDASVLRVSSTGALHVTGGGGGTEYTEDVATPNPIVGTSTVMERDDALSTLTPIEGDWAAMRCSAEGALWTQDFNSDGMASSLTDIETNTDFGAVTGGGAEATALRVTLANDSTGVISIDDGGNTITVDGTVTANAGTGTMTVDLGANNDVVVAGDVAHDSADSGNPTKIGAKVESDIDTITLAADGDRTDLYAGRDGILYTHQDGPLENLVNGNANATGTANTSTIAAQGAGIKTYLTDIIVTNASATDSEVIIKDGTTEKMRIAAPANGGAVSVGFRSPVAGTANTAWQFASADAVTTMYVFMSGFTSQV